MSDRVKRRGLTALFIVLILTSAVLIGIVCLKIAKAEPIDTYHSSWQLVRATADEDGASFAAVYDLTGVGATNGHFADKDASTVASGGPFRIRPISDPGRSEGFSPGQKWMFAFCGENFNNTDDTFSFNLVGWSRTNGMLQNIAEGDGVLGTQAVVVYPDDGSDAMGGLINETSVVYTHATKTFTVTNQGFTGAVAGMLVRVTGSNLTSGIVQITTATDANNIICSGVTSTNNNTNSTVQGNPAFWADTINLDQTTKWASAIADPNMAAGYGKLPGTLGVINSGDNEVACLIVDLTGLEWIQFVIYDADGETGEEAGNITVYGRRY